MAGPTTPRGRVWLYIRLTLASGLAAIVVGYYFQLIGRVIMTPFEIFSFASRGIIIGLLFWWFEVFYVHGPAGHRLRELAYKPRLIVKVVAYMVLIESGFLIGFAAFHPSETMALLFSAAP